MISNKHQVQDLVQLFKFHGLEHVVISPGSRNAPISISLEADNYFSTYSIIDERSAGFFALGIAQQIKKPVALVCTSGSAAYNYAPAVAEAFYQRIPLVVITADRPAEWVDQGDGQTMKQWKLYGDHVRFAAQLESHTLNKDADWYNQRMINEALNKCIGSLPGPVHLNIPFREPLYETEESPSSRPKAIKTIEPENSLSVKDLEQLNQELADSGRILILCGMLQADDELERVLEQVSEHKEVLVLTETTSNLASENFIACIDRLIMSFDREEEEQFRPDILLSIGNQIISKKIKFLLRKLNISKHWHIGFEDVLLDTFQCLTLSIPMQPSAFFSQVKFGAKNPEDYSQKWLQKEQKNRQLHQSFIEKAPYSDLKVFHYLLEGLNGEEQLQMGNSSVVRYIQLFDQVKGVRYFGNRGVSGIDGSTSTAIGAAWVSNEPVLFITGDVAALYDSNALWLKYRPKNIKIVVINNGGGGIFRIIEGPSSTPYLKEHFEASHDLGIQKLAEHGKWNYIKVTTEAELKTGLDQFQKSPESTILEIVTPQEDNDAVLKQYFRFLKANK
jgi:2-succinyl-5-enolpyruvyl-6-hydroxy-3-cyclohexene-1-carboxylate synthase